MKSPDTRAAAFDVEPDATPTTGAPDHEQRRHGPRERRRKWIGVVVLNNRGEPVDVERHPTFNLSRGGVGLLLDYELAVGTQVLLCLAVGSDEARGADDPESDLHTIHRSGQVRHCTPAELPGFFVVGVSFTNDVSLVNSFDWSGLP